VDGLEESARPTDGGESATEEVGSRAPVLRAVRWILASDIDRLFLTEASARALDAEGIHELRRATRRLRATLRSFRPYLDALWNQGLRDEVRWLSGEVGLVRDLQVLRDRLVSTLGEDEARGELFEVIEERCQQAKVRVVEAFESSRYEQLRERLVEAAENPWVQRDLGERCGRALGRRVERMWRRVRRQAKALKGDLPDEQYHSVRKRGKDLRSALEAFRPWMKREQRKASKRLGEKLGRLVGVLGSRQDAVMSRRFLWEFAQGLPTETEARAAAERWIATEGELIEKLGRRSRSVWRTMDRRSWVD
jgi:CHAD domain-containing protein